MRCLLYFTPIFTKQTVAWSLLLKRVTQLVQSNLGFKQQIFSSFCFQVGQVTVTANDVLLCIFLYTWISCTYIGILWELKYGVGWLCRIAGGLPLRCTGGYSHKEGIQVWACDSYSILLLTKPKYYSVLRLCSVAAERWLFIFQIPFTWLFFHNWYGLISTLRTMSCEK